MIQKRSEHGLNCCTKSSSGTGATLNWRNRFVNQKKKNEDRTQPKVNQKVYRRHLCYKSFNRVQNINAHILKSFLTVIPVPDACAACALCVHEDDIQKCHRDANEKEEKKEKGPKWERKHSLEQNSKLK